MTWNFGGQRTLYHGTTLASANAIMNGGPLLAMCRANTDFGLGFYLTTYLHQARNWVNTRIQPWAGPSSNPAKIAAVLAFAVDWDRLAGLESMAFVIAGSYPDSDFWDFVAHCRGGGYHDQRGGATRWVDVVYGPVTLWSQTLTVAGADQISFHNQIHVEDAFPASLLRRRRIYQQGTPSDPYVR
jgi:hypothetical protein